MENIPLSKFNCIGALLEAAKKYEVNVETVDEKSQLMIFSKNEESYYIRKHTIDVNSYMSSIVTSNKFLAKHLLKNNDIPVPEGFKRSNLSNALKMLDNNDIKFPLVVKPTDGSQGGAVTVDIRSKAWLEKAIKEVHKYNSSQKGRLNSFLIEEYIKGDDYRFLVLDGKVLTVIMRKPAYVVGDGKKTLGQLINEYNDQPGVSKAQPLCPIVRDYEFERNISEQGLSEENIIESGKTIYLRKNANVSTGGRSFECCDDAHSEYFELMEKIVKIFGIRFCAIDIIAQDISKYEKFKVIEMNHNPGFDIHEVPYRGKPFRVAEKIIESMFSKTIKAGPSSV